MVRESEKDGLTEFGRQKGIGKDSILITIPEREMEKHLEDYISFCKEQIRDSKLSQKLNFKTVYRKFSYLMGIKKIPNDLQY